MSEAAKQQQLSMLAEVDIANNLLSDMNVSALNLKVEEDYISFAKKVGGVLY